MRESTDHPGMAAHAAVDRPRRGRRRTAVRALVALVSLAAVLVIGAAPSGQAVSPTTRHFIANLHGSTAPAALGFDVFDTGASTVASLPNGVSGLVWLGEKCPTVADAAFRATVDQLASSPRVFGYYLSDEPHVSDCPGGAAALRSRADYIRSRTAGSQKSFIVLSRTTDYSAFSPANSHVDLIGLDPYPCSTASPTCPVRKITDKVVAALDAGIPQAAIVPVLQAFGQERLSGGYYRLPTAAQLSAMLAEWHRLVPSPVMDYAYGWGNQSSSNPTLVDSADLQKVLAAHNGVVTR